MPAFLHSCLKRLCGIAHIDKSIDDIVQAGERKHFTMVWLGPHCVRKSWDTRARELDDMLRGKFTAGDEIVLDVREGTVVFEKKREPVAADKGV